MNLKVPILDRNKDDGKICPDMTFRERITGFLVCCIIGYALSILAVVAFLTKKKDVKVFAIFYTLGNIVNLSGTAFLAGCHNQWKKMTKDTRLAATLIFFVAMIATLAAAFLMPEGGPQRLTVLLAVVIQFCAFFWYSLTFIPFGRRMFKSACKSCCSQCMDEVK